MKDQVFRVEYFAFTADDRPGEGARLGDRLKKEGVNLLGISVFPTGPGIVQVDLIPESPESLVKAAKKMGIHLGSPKTAFLIQGTDRPGAMAEVLERLGNVKINARAAIGLADGGNRYGAVLWVAQSDVDAAARALGATSMATHHV